MATAGYLILAFGAVLAGGTGKAPLGLEVVFFILVDFSIPWIDTVILTMITRDAPPAIVSTVLGLYYLATAGGNLLTGILGAWADKMSMPAFWLMHAGINGAILLFVALAGFKLTQWLRPASDVVASGLIEEPSAA